MKTQDRNVKALIIIIDTPILPLEGKNADKLRAALADARRELESDARYADLLISSRHVSCRRCIAMICFWLSAFPSICEYAVYILRQSYPLET